MQDKTLIIDDYIAKKIREVWIDKGEVLKDIVESYDYKILQPHTEKMKQITLETGDSDLIEKELYSLQESLENALKRIIEKYSIIHWLQLESRFPYHSDVHKTRLKSTVPLYRATFRVAILKYARVDVDNIERDKNTGEIYLKDLSEEMIIDLYKCDRLSFSYYMSTADLRNLWKGGTPTFDSERPIFAWEYGKKCGRMYILDG